LDLIFRPPSGSLTAIPSQSSDK